MKNKILLDPVIVVALGSLLLATAVTAVDPQDQKKIDEYKMTTYQVVFLTKGPGWTEVVSPQTESLLSAHRAYIRELQKSGRVHVAGPFGEASDPNLRGVLILSGSPEQARAVVEADPGVKDGRWAFEILKWMAPEGWFQKPTDLSQTEKIYFGFLASGPTRSQDAETAQTLQRGHLDYMDGQAKQGKLVLAGPLLDAGTRRGLIAYRVATMQEAIDRASADPMIKAGRLVPELYEWTIPKGVLK
jgi:uncharacterized protein YciI